jgi:hypothetical protein
MPLAVVVAATKLLGAPLPHNAVAWIGMLIGLWASLATVQVAILAYLDEHLGRPVEVRLTGYILPFGWILWGAALIYGNPSPLRVLIVLLGLLGMLATAAELRRVRAAAVAQTEGQGA